MDLNYSEIYRVTKDTFDKLVKDNNIQNVDRYLHPTDHLLIPGYDSFSWRQKLFASMVFHAQNRQLLSSIIDFRRNALTIEKILYTYDATKFLSKYGSPLDKPNEMKFQQHYSNLSKLLEDLESNLQRQGGALLSTFASSVMRIAYFVDSFTAETDYKNFFAGMKRKDKIDFFRNNFPGFGEALAYDFLKENGVYAFDFAKPDVHIKDFIEALNTRCVSNQIIKMFEDVVHKIQKINPNLSVYEFDKMIWLICSGYFYLDNVKDNTKLRKCKFLNKIAAI